MAAFWARATEFPDSTGHGAPGWVTETLGGSSLSSWRTGAAERPHHAVRSLTGVSGAIAKSQGDRVWSAHGLCYLHRCLALLSGHVLGCGTQEGLVLSGPHPELSQERVPEPVSPLWRYGPCGTAVFGKALGEPHAGRAARDKRGLISYLRS